MKKYYRKLSKALRTLNAFLDRMIMCGKLIISRNYPNTTKYAVGEIKNYVLHRCK